MVITGQSNFISRFNLAVKQRSRTFQVPISKLVTSLLSAIIFEGYVISYSVCGTNYTVLLNNKSVDFTLKQISTPSRPVYFNCSYLSKSKNSGFRLIVQSASGAIFFSEFFKFSRIGGRVLYRLQSI